MNREIKFRGKPIGINNFVYGYYCKDFENKTYITTLDGVDTYTVDSKTIGQYTGLKDKNGKEIYEGDIVEYTNDRNCHNYIGKIVYKDCEFCIEVIKSTSFKGTSHLMLISDKGFTNNEIIGNVHENPEVL